MTCQTQVARPPACELHCSRRLTVGYSANALAEECRVPPENASSANANVWLCSGSSPSMNRETDMSRRPIAWPKRSWAEEYLAATRLAR